MFYFYRESFGGNFCWIWVSSGYFYVWLLRLYDPIKLLPYKLDGMDWLKVDLPQDAESLPKTCSASIAKNLNSFLNSFIILQKTDFLISYLFW